MSLFWTNPTALFWTNPTALFWSTAVDLTLSEIGSATGSFSESSGVYTVTGTGNGVAGANDSLVFVNQAVSGNIEIISNVTAQTGTNAYAISGLMIRDSQTAANAQCAMVSVSPLNGVNFSCRLADGDTASTTLGPSIATPVWLRLVVSQTSVAGYQSPDGTDWELVGVCTMTLPADYYCGFAVASNTTTSNQTTFSYANFLQSVPQRSENMLSWLRADAAITYDSSASNAVSLWADQSANGYNGTQSTSGNRPEVEFNVANGLPAVSFSSNDFLVLPAGLTDFTAGCSLFVVLSPSSFANNATVIDIGNGSAGNNLSIRESNSTGGVEFIAANGTTSSSVVANTALITGQFQLLEVVYDGVSNAEIFLNGTSIASSTTMQSSVNVNRTDNFIGQSGAGGSYFLGAIAEIILCNIALGNTDRQSIENYFSQKYSI